MVQEKMEMLTSKREAYVIIQHYYLPHSTGVL